VTGRASYCPKQSRFAAWSSSNVEPLFLFGGTNQPCRNIRQRDCGELAAFVLYPDPAVSHTRYRRRIASL